jgi:hypothetical protein
LQRRQFWLAETKHSINFQQPREKASEAPKDRRRDKTKSAAINGGSLSHEGTGYESLFGLENTGIKRISFVTGTGPSPKPRQYVNVRVNCVPYSWIIKGQSNLRLKKI